MLWRSGGERGSSSESDSSSCSCADMLRNRNLYCFGEPPARCRSRKARWLSRFCIRRLISRSFFPLQFSLVVTKMETRILESDLTIGYRSSPGGHGISEPVYWYCIAAIAGMQTVVMLTYYMRRAYCTSIAQSCRRGARGNIALGNRDLLRSEFAGLYHLAFF